MKIKMKRTTFGLMDGLRLQKLEAGKVYDVRDSVYSTLTQNDYATTDLDHVVVAITPEERAAYFAKPRWAR